MLNYYFLKKTFLTKRGLYFKIAWDNGYQILLPFSKKKTSKCNTLFFGSGGGIIFCGGFFKSIKNLKQLLLKFFEQIVAERVASDLQNGRLGKVRARNPTLKARAFMLKNHLRFLFNNSGKNKANLCIPSCN